MSDSTLSPKTQTELSGRERKRFRQIAHHLQPVVTIGDKGLSDSLLTEIDRALRDHELIKLRLSNAEREQRQSLGRDLAQQTNSSIVQTLGKTLVLFRKNSRPDPRLSNLVRFQD